MKFYNLFRWVLTFGNFFFFTHLVFFVESSFTCSHKCRKPFKPPHAEFGFGFSVSVFSEGVVVVVVVVVVVINVFSPASFFSSLNKKKKKKHLLYEFLFQSKKTRYNISSYKLIWADLLLFLNFTIKHNIYIVIGKCISLMPLWQFQNKIRILKTIMAKYFSKRLKIFKLRGCTKLRLIKQPI